MSTDETAVRWWQGLPDEIFWLEITDRADLGVDLNAPAERETGGQYWSYALVREVREGDIVLHYRARPINAITHWSRAVGEAYADTVFWGAHGQASGRGPVSPYWRDGWRLRLDGPYELPEPVTNSELRSLEVSIRDVRAELEAQHPGQPLYFPFQLSDTRPVRAVQGYLAKFPAGLVDAIPALRDVAQEAATTWPRASARAPRAPRRELGDDYRPANPDARAAPRRPFSVDPDLVDRALAGHARTQESLAASVRAAGLAARSPSPGEPVFDIAWEDGEHVVVAEVKSLTIGNEERQLRLALGQVLRYAHLLRAKGRHVRAAIAAERQPTDPTWAELCAELDVALVWPDTFTSLFDGTSWPSGVVGDA